MFHFVFLICSVKTASDKSQKSVKLYSYSSFRTKARFTENESVFADFSCFFGL